MNSKTTENYLTIGVLGGMGPDATVECYKSIIEQTPAKKDQDHLPLLIYNNPQIPDRTESILHNGISPVPQLQDSAHRLEEAGADLIIMPCNTAHYFIEKIREVIEIPVLNMVKATVDKLPPGSVAGLLATTGTIKTGIYEKYAADRLKIITPSDENQKTVMDAIYGKRGIKAGFKDDRLTNKLIQVVDHLKEKGADSIIAGCTEIRLVLNDSNLVELDLLTPIDVIAREAVQRARSGEFQ